MKNADSAPIAVNLIVLPLTFISNIWFPTNSLPAALRTIASMVPVTALASALQCAFDPRHPGLALDGSALRVPAIWTVLGSYLMIRFLRRPTGDDVA